MQIQISWLLQKPTDLDLHCLQRQDISGFSRKRLRYVGLQVYTNFDVIALAEALISTKGYKYFSSFCMKTYVLGTHYKQLGKVLLLSTHKVVKQIC